jgi:hypothetical protein
MKYGFWILASEWVNFSPSATCWNMHLFAITKKGVFTLWMHALMLSVLFHLSVFQKSHLFPCNASLSVILPDRHRCNRVKFHAENIWDIMLSTSPPAFALGNLSLWHIACSNQWYWHIDLRYIGKFQQIAWRMKCDFILVPTLWFKACILMSLNCLHELVWLLHRLCVNKLHFIFEWFCHLVLKFYDIVGRLRTWNTQSQKLIVFWSFPRPWGV